MRTYNSQIVCRIIIIWSFVVFLFLVFNKWKVIYKLRLFLLSDYSVNHLGLEKQTVCTKGKSQHASYFQHRMSNIQGINWDHTATYKTHPRGSCKGYDHNRRFNSAEIMIHVNCEIAFVKRAAGKERLKVEQLLLTSYTVDLGMGNSIYPATFGFL